MFITYKKTKVNYEIVGDGQTDIVFLHGWGGNINSFKFLCKHLTFSFRAMFIDFPPFGKSGELKQPLTIYDYAEMVERIVKKEKFRNYIFVGHSFGGRVSLILSNNKDVKKLVLIDSAGLKPKRSLMYYIKVYSYKLIKKLGIKVNAGSKDYRNLSPVMKKTFVNIVNTNLEKYAKMIKIPTLIIWGKKDKDTPMYMAKKLNKLINNSNLIVFSNAKHFSYIDNLPIFVNVLNNFCENKL